MHACEVQVTPFCISVRCLYMNYLHHNKRMLKMLSQCNIIVLTHFNNCHGTIIFPTINRNYDGLVLFHREQKHYFLSGV